MQASPSQRSQQRRSPQIGDQGLPLSNDATSTQNGHYSSGQSIAANSRPAPPPSSNSSRASSSATVVPASGSSKKKDSQLSQIEKSVTHLLIATKQLLETLTQWSRKNATETQVSDVYVRLGYEFNIACRAFASINVDVSDLGNVPDSLRQILEETLSQEASQKSLDIYLPKIRDIIINLLHGLKRKQAKLRAKAKEGQALPRTTSGASTTSSLSGNNNIGLTELLDDIPSAYPAAMPRANSPARRQVSQGSIEEPRIPARNSSTQQQGQNLREEPTAQHGYSNSREEAHQRHSTSAREELHTSDVNSRISRERKQPPPSVTSSISSEALQDIPVISPDDNRISHAFLDNPPAPPVPPKQSEALLALQRGGELERRASRRYSQWQYNQLAPSGSMPTLPSVQNSPVPNRGRDVKESLNAVRTRSSMLLSRQRSQRLRESPHRGTTLQNRISEEYSGSKNKASTSSESDISPMQKTPEDKLGNSYIDAGSEYKPRTSATLQGPLVDQFPTASTPGSESLPAQGDLASDHNREESVDVEPFVPELSPQPGKPLTLFIQYKSRIKKIVFPDGSNDLSLAAIQLAFIDKFQWNVKDNGVELPEIYIQDQTSGVRHELEDLADIKDRSVLVLNVEPLEEVKQHFDSGLDGLRQLMEGIRSTLEGQQAAMSQVSTRQDEAAKEMARLASRPHSLVGPSNGPVNGLKPQATNTAYGEISSLRRDLASMRQSFTSFSTGATASMATIREKALEVKSKAHEFEVPELDVNSGPVYVKRGMDTIGQGTESLISNVDDLQDLVEDLRKDVVTRGVRPLPRQLEQVGKDISDAHRDLLKLQEFVKKEKPIWTKVWTKSLNTVMTDREYVTLQEELIGDLQADLAMAAETFSLVEQATKQQNAETAEGKPPNLRSTSRTLDIVPAANPMKAKDGVLGEVRALQPNHETRLQAIERAERARQKELEDRHENAVFKKELGSFVHEGKLRPTVGIEELERQIREKNELAIREEHQAVEVVKMSRAKARAEERARQAQAQVEAMQSAGEGNEQQEEGEEDEQFDDAEEPRPLPPAKDDHPVQLNGIV